MGREGQREIIDFQESFGNYLPTSVINMNTHLSGRGCTLAHKMWQHQKIGFYFCQRKYVTMTATISLKKDVLVAERKLFVVANLVLFAACFFYFFGL